MRRIGAVRVAELIRESSGNVEQTIKKRNIHISLFCRPKSSSHFLLLWPGPLSSDCSVWHNKRLSLQQTKLFQMWWLTLQSGWMLTQREKMKNGDRFLLNCELKSPRACSAARSQSRAEVQPRCCKSPDYIWDDGKRSRRVREREIIFITICFQCLTDESVNRAKHDTFSNQTQQFW